ncbi:GspH/FimT family pseudopilin [Sphingomonas oligophenolica]|uniref:Type II secretion system protein H n=1 Tax=Sphingomonas oligophenolica TaxID=301154 RepID=A0ABU9XXL3_9SPHN
MPISPAGNSAHARGRSAEHGFTLIELMIVIMIIGLATAMVVWALPDPRGRLLDEATRFAARARAAQQVAIVDARPVSVWVSAGGYGFDQRRQGAWAAIGEKPFEVTSWGRGTSAAVANGGGRDRVMFDSTGFADRPLDVRLTRDTEAVMVHVGADGGVKVGA